MIRRLTNFLYVLTIILFFFLLYQTKVYGFLSQSVIRILSEGVRVEDGMLSKIQEKFSIRKKPFFSSKLEKSEVNPNKAKNTNINEFNRFIGQLSIKTEKRSEYKNDNILEFITKWGKRGSREGEFNNPRGITVNELGQVFVSDQSNNRIQKFDSNGTFISEWSMGSLNESTNYYPTDIASDNTGHVYVVSRGQVHKFSYDGKLMDRFGSQGNGTGQWAGDAGIAIDLKGKVYVSAPLNNKLIIFNSKGDFLEEWDQNVSPYKDFFPLDVAIDSHGNVYVIESRRQNILKYNSNDMFIKKFNYPSIDVQKDRIGWCIAVDVLGDIFVTDSENHKIYKYNADGQFIGWWGKNGALNGQLNMPMGIATDKHGYIYIADMGNHRIQKYKIK